MIDQAYSGFGAVGNDMYAPFDPGYARICRSACRTSSRPSRCSRRPGTTTTSPSSSSPRPAPLGGDEVAAAQVFAEQAKGAGVTVKVKKVDSGVFYGDEYLNWPFAQDFWYTRNYLAQASQGTLPGAPYNETHWENAEWQASSRRRSRRSTTTARNELISAGAADRVRRGRLHHLGRSATRSTPTSTRSAASCRTSSACRSAELRLQRTSTSSEADAARQRLRALHCPAPAARAGPLAVRAVPRDRRVDREGGVVLAAAAEADPHPRRPRGPHPVPGVASSCSPRRRRCPATPAQAILGKEAANKERYEALREQLGLERAARRAVPRLARRRRHRRPRQLARRRTTPVTELLSAGACVNSFDRSCSWRP